MSGWTGRARAAVPARVSAPVLACALAAALALAPCGAAQAAYLPEGTGEFGVDVLTGVVPTVDTDATLHNVRVHVVCELGGHVPGADLEVFIDPPNAEPEEVGRIEDFFDGSEADQPDADQPAPASVVRGGRAIANDLGDGLPADDAEGDAAAGEGAEPDDGLLHVLRAGGATGSDGMLLLENAAVGATYRVVASKDGHEGFEGSFACAGDADEVWEVVLRHIPEDEDGAGILPLPSWQGGCPYADDGTSQASLRAGADAGQAPVASFATWFRRLFYPENPALLIAAAVFAAGAAGLLFAAWRTRKKDDEEGGKVHGD